MVNLKNKKYKITINLIVNLLNSFFFIFTIVFKPCCVGGGGEQCTGYIYPHLFLSVNACQSEFNSRVHAWCTCIWTHFFTCKSENLNLCFWICEIIAAPKRLHSSTQKQIVFICFISFVYTLNTKGTWMQTFWRRNQVMRYLFNFFPITWTSFHFFLFTLIDYNPQNPFTWRITSRVYSQYTYFPIH